MNFKKTDVALEEVLTYMSDKTARHIRKNYGFNIAECNAEMIQLAEKYLEVIRTYDNVKDINATLEELFSTLPRKPKSKKKRKELLADRVEDREWIYERERNLLDMVKAAVLYLEEMKKTKANPSELVRAAGVGLKKVDWKRERVIKDMSRHYPGTVRGIYEIIRSDRREPVGGDFSAFNVWYSDDDSELFPFLMLGDKADRIKSTLLFDSSHKKGTPIWDSYHNVTISFLLSMEEATPVGVLNDVDLYRMSPDCSLKREYMVIFSR